MKEKEFLNNIAKLLHKTKSFDWREDCVIIPTPNNMNLIYSLDRPENIFSTTNENNSFRLYGRWSAGIVANDIIACGAFPKGIAFDVGTEEFSEDDFKQWIRGVLDVCSVYNMKYDGGNIGIGRGIVGMAYGFQKEKFTLRRKGANDNDVILVTANLGLGWVLKLFQNRYNLKDFKELKILQKYKSEPWVNLHGFAEIWKMNVINSSMDITDGIIEFGYEIFEKNNLGVVFTRPEEIFQPLEFMSRKLNLPVEALFFEPGYDTPFAHSWCINSQNVTKVTKTLTKFNIPYTIIGTVSRNVKGVFYRNKRKLIELPRYWDDVYCDRGSIEFWNSSILPLF